MVDTAICMTIDLGVGVNCDHVWVWYYQMFAESIRNVEKQNVIIGSSKNAREAWQALQSD